MQPLDSFSPPPDMEIIPSSWQKKIRFQFLYHDLASVLQDIWIDQIQKKESDRLTRCPLEDDWQLIVSLVQLDPSQEKNKILQFAKLLHTRAQVSLIERGYFISRHTIQTFHEQVGQLIFLFDHSLAEITSKIDLDNISDSLSLIKDCFNNHMSQRFSEIENKRELVEEIGVQSSSKAYNIERSVLIAKTLFSKTGKFNRGIIESIKRHCVHEKDLVHTLNDLQHNKDLCQLLESIQAPKQPYCASNDLIRITLNLPMNAPLSDREARMAALAALLADIKQETIGLCLNSTIPSSMLSKMRSKLLQAFKEILQEGKFTRMDGKKTEVPLIIDLEDPSLHATFYTDISCQFISAKKYLWHLPGFIAAGKQMGIENELLESAIRRNMISLYEIKKLEMSELIEISPELLIIQIAKDIARERRLTSNQLDDLQNLGLLAYISVTTQLLLKAWQTCYELISSTQSAKIIHQKIRESVLLSIENYWPFNFFNQKQNQLVKKMQAIFAAVIQQSFYICYNEQESLNSTNESLGVFVLKEVDKGQRALYSKQIKTPEEFKKFVLKRLKISADSIYNEPISNRSIQKEAIKKIQIYLEKNNGDRHSFLNDVIRIYDTTNHQLTYPIKEWKKILHLPFRDYLNGYDLPFAKKARLFDARHEATLRPKTGIQLLEALIVYGRKQQKDGHQFLGEQHKINEKTVIKLFPSSSLLDQAIFDTNRSAFEWIHENVVAPGFDVSLLIFWDKNKNLFSDLIAQKLLHSNLLPIFQERLSLIDKNCHTIHQYSQELLNILLDLNLNNDGNSAEEISTSLTNILLKHIIPETALHHLIKKAIKVAEIELKNRKKIDLVCFFDPITNKIQLGTLEEKVLKLRMLNSREWSAYMPWEHYGIKLRPMPVDYHAEIL